MESKKFKILAFDPGTAHTGWSLLEGNTENGDLVVLKVGELRPGPTAEKAKYRSEVDKFDKKVITLSLLREMVTGLLVETKPDFVAAEDIYINMFRPMAFASLSMWMCTVRLACRDVAQLPMTAIPTKICKKITAGRGDSQKLTIQSAIVSHPHLKFKDDDLKMQLSEHIADSIAVGIAFADRYRDLILETIGR